MKSVKGAASRAPESNSESNSLPPEVLEPLKNLAVVLTRITEEVAKADSTYVTSLKAAISHLREKLFVEIEASVRKEMDAQLKTAVSTARDQFNAQLQSATAEYEKENSRLVKALASAKRGDSQEQLQAEIDRTARLLNEISEGMARLLEDPEVELAKVIKENAAQSELKAYMRGLMYQADPDPAKK